MSPAATHDVHRGALPFPRSLPEFQRLFPDDAACGAAHKAAELHNGPEADRAMYPERY